MTMDKNLSAARGKLLRGMVLLSYAGLLLWFSLAPRLPRIPLPALSWDKLHHAGAYFVLTLLTCWVLLPWGIRQARGRLTALIFALAFGGLVEIAQGLFTDARSASLLDMLANAVGAFAAFGAAFLLFPAPRRDGGRSSCRSPLAGQKKAF